MGECEDLKQWRPAVMNHLYWTAASTPNGDANVIEAKWKSMVSSECDLNLCLLLPACISLREEYCRVTTGSTGIQHNLVFQDPFRGSTR